MSKKSGSNVGGANGSLDSAPQNHITYASCRPCCGCPGLPCGPQGCCNFTPPQPCPPCPPPVFPPVACTDALRVFLSVTQTVANAAIIVPDGFNPNDGPPPYTVLSADLVGSQQAVTNLQVSSVSPAQSRVSAQVRPTVLIEYRDGANATRTKFIDFPVAIIQTYATPDAGDPLAFFVALRPGGTITGLSGTGNSITFTANLSLFVAGYVNEPERLAVLPGFTCAAPPPGYPAECGTILRLRSACNARAELLTTFVTSIPFRQLGTPPFTAVTVALVDSMPNILVAEPDAGLMSLQLSFPAVLSYTDSTNTLYTQDVLVYTSVQIEGVAVAPEDLLIADLRIGRMSTPIFAGTFFITNIEAIAGLVMVVANQTERVLTTQLVDCGAFPVPDTCILTTMFTVTESE